MKILKCMNCGTDLENAIKCEKCGHMNWTDKQLAFLKTMNERVPKINQMDYMMVRHRVPKNEKPNVLLDGSYKRRAIEAKNKEFVVGRMYEHTTGDIWIIQELTDVSVTIAVINKDKTIEENSARTLSRKVFASLISNMYYSHTLIPYRMIGADIAAANMRDNFLRW